MADINLSVLEAAYDDKLFDSRPSDNQFTYLSQAIVTAWTILEIVESHSELGIDGNTIAQMTGLNYNTIKIYLRWLRSKDLIQSERTTEQGAPQIHYR